MKKTYHRVFKLLLACLCALIFSTLQAQVPDIEKLRSAIKKHPQKDTARVNCLNGFALVVRKTEVLESYKAYQESLALAQKLSYTKGMALAELGLGFHYRFANNYPASYDYSNRALNHFKITKDTLNQIACIYNLSSTAVELGKLDESIDYDFEGLKLARLKKDEKWTVLISNHLAIRYSRVGEDEKAKNYAIPALKLAEKVGDSDGILHCLSGLAFIAVNEGKFTEALRYSQRDTALALKIKDLRTYYETKMDIASINTSMGNYSHVIGDADDCLKNLNRTHFFGDNAYAYSIKSQAYLHLGKADSSIKYGLLSFNSDQKNGEKINTQNISKVLADAYASLGKFKEAYHYQVLFTNYKDSVNETAAIRKVTSLQYTDDIAKKQTEIKLLTKSSELANLQNRQQKIWLIFVVAGLLAAGVFSFVLIMSNRQKQAANKLLHQQQQELKTTQRQLIQSEKLASLGELTAGIAHEIQNPLNFVNNFSEVSVEMLQEMEQELNAGDKNEAIAIAGELKQNLEKITYHGKRAESIVKGMLQHSRASTGVKEPTDINQLADEYLRLTYHGLRAKDKSFNAELVTNFDPALPKANIIPQDIGRVLLNVLNNAFYAVNERKKREAESWMPEVTVTTAAAEGFVMITVTDNGNGMSDAVKDKIMQPFFTTKPTGEGTGLGLSLSYDIVVKGHGGKIEVDTEEGLFTEFKVILPVN